MPLPTRLQTLFIGLACLLPAFAGATERIIDSRNGTTLTSAQLVAALTGVDYLLLGEVHDNTLHHQRRADLLKQLGGQPAVVAEHLTGGNPVADSGPLLAALEAAGFEARNWRWPLHEPLFAAVRESGWRLVGGNVSRQVARAIVQDGSAAIPPRLAATLEKYPMDEATSRQLDADLLANHCNQIPASLVPRLRLAQQVRDAAMFVALADSAGRPNVLLAGNGHVRKDYGIPRLLALAYPARRQISIGFLEEGNEAPTTAEIARYDYVWVTAPASRNDPCADFRRPARTSESG
ncbi:MAG: hypothetical protein D3M94_00965 [Rhodocyclales bacterium GT-UBC]|nr:MAG: hypothetical protein D3M94_00965 [Rhodocyclales bacterium GT-UBC]